MGIYNRVKVALPKSICLPVPAGVELCILARQTGTREREVSEGHACLLSFQGTVAVFTVGPECVISGFRAGVLGSET